MESSLGFRPHLRMRYFVLKPFELPADWMHPRIIRVTPEAALGLVLARDVISRTDIPRFAFARRDGWAVRAEDEPLTRRPLSVAVENGAAPARLTPGDAVWINTGGIIPEGANAVISSVNTLDPAACRASAETGDNIQARGSDWKAGDVVLAAGKRIGAREQALLLEADVSEVEGLAKPVVGVISTGNEIAAPNGVKGLYQKRTSNAVYITALMKRIGIEEVFWRTVKDDCASIAACVASLSRTCDVIITIGGTGRGSCDFTRAAVHAAGGRLIEQPLLEDSAPPFVMARVGEASLIGLPGNPLGSMMIAQRVLLKMLKDAFSLPEMPADTCEALITETIDAGVTGELCVSLYQVDGIWQADPVLKSSGRSRIFETADGIVKLNGKGFGVGDAVKAEFFAN